MKFMVNWSIDQENWIPILEKWSAMTAEQRMDAGDGVKILGRWHDMSSRTGVAIIEASDAAAMQSYLGMWNPHMEMDASAVVDDDESVKVAKAIIAGQG